MVETHFHPRNEEEFSQNLQQAFNWGVTRLVAVGSNLQSSRYVNDLAERYDGVYSTAGVHPHEAKDCGGDLEPFEELFKKAGNCAVGEIGLDYYYGHSEVEVQKTIFRRFIRLGDRYQLPLIIHCRDAYDDCLDILKEELAEEQAFEIHSCTAAPDWVDEIVDMGGYVGFNGIITFKNADNVRAALDRVPMERLLLETDSPYLAPVPYRGKPNYPAYVKYVAQYVADRKGVSFEEISRVTTENAVTFFSLS